MTDCSICGRPAVTRAFVEGAMLDVCGNCVSYGKEAVSPGGRQSAAPVAPERQFEVVDVYGPIVAAAIARAGKPLDEFASGHFINADYLRQIASGKRVPDEKTARKLEHALAITLVTESVGEGAAIVQQGRSKGGFTLADVAQIRKGRK